MLRSALTATAIALLLAAPAHGQSATSPSLAPAPTTELEQAGLTPPTVLSQGYAVTGQDLLATKFLGQKVFETVNDNAQEIGTINDMVVTPGLGVSAVVIGVGGFLGVGEKNVAMDFDQLQYLERADGTRRWVLATTADELRQAPAFIWEDSVEATGTPPISREQQQDQLIDNPNATPIDPKLTSDQPERPIIATPPTQSGMSAVDRNTLSADQLVGIPVYGINDQQIGTISDVVLTPQGNSDAVIVDVGGFLGIGAKPVAIAFENLTFSTDTGGTRYLFLNTAREQLENQPTYEADTYQANRAQQRLVIAP